MSSAETTAYSSSDAPGAAASRALRILLVAGENNQLRIPFLLKLRERGFEVGAAGTDGPTEFDGCGIACYRYDLQRFIAPLSDWRALAALARIISVFDADIVQAFDTKPDILAPVAAKRAGKGKVVRTINGLGWAFASRSPMALGLRPVLRGLYRATAPSTSLTVFQNRSDAAYFEKKGLVGRGEYQLIPGSGIDVDGFAAALAAAPPTEEMRLALGLGADAVVTTVSRLSRAKGIPTLLKAAALVNEQRPGTRFVLVGARETEGRLACPQSEIDRHAPYVKAIGRRKDIAALLKLSDVFVYPTELCEGIPRALLEAALAGVPIVATDVPGSTDVVENGLSGFVVPPGDAEALGRRIGDLLDDPEGARAMAERARSRVIEKFNLDMIVDMYANAYRRLFAGDARLRQ